MYQVNKERGAYTELNCIERGNFAAQGLHDKSRHCIADISVIDLSILEALIGFSAADCDSPIDDLGKTSQSFGQS